jgi:hypothetical protein
MALAMATAAAAASVGAPAGAAWAASTAAAPGLPTLPAGSLPQSPVAPVLAPVPVVEPLAQSLLGSGAPAGPAPRAATAGVSPASATPQLTVSPDTNLTDGQRVTVTASGMKANAYGSVLECNLAPNEPTVSVQGNDVPVGCTNPLSTLKSTDASGGFTTPFTIHTGTIGPPAQGTDSAGNPAPADAAKYPCPPTPAQQSGGTTCDVVYGDTAGDQAKAPLGFAGTASPSAASGSSGGAAAATAGASGSSGAASGSGGSGGSATTAGTGASSGTLAFTGFGPGVQALARAGALLVVLGSIVMLAGAVTQRRGQATGTS